MIEKDYRMFVEEIEGKFNGYHENIDLRIEHFFRSYQIQHRFLNILHK